MVKNLDEVIKKINSDLFGSKINQKQSDGIRGIIAEWNKHDYTDLRWLAYMLATVYHETAKTMQPIEEYGKGKKYDYGKKLKRSRVPYTTPDKLYYGRGFVQLTWYENYQLMGRLLKVDLLNNPELACTIEIATEILFEGMTKGASSFGDFTGKCLEMYFNDKTEDWVNARKIINGLDCAEKIAGYGKNFYNILKNN
jgi:putative chitinase